MKEKASKRKGMAIQKSSSGKNLNFGKHVEYFACVVEHLTCEDMNGVYFKGGVERSRSV